jgi:hypothetical protein
VTPAQTALRSVALACAVSVAFAVAGCGGGGGGAPAGEVLEQTTAKLASIRSAELGLRLVLEPREAASQGRIGFELRGPVELRAGRLPVARLEYKQIAGRQEAGATFLATGRESFVELGGISYRLPEGETASLARGAGSIRSGATLPLGRWLEDPKVEDGGEIDGTVTDHVSARLDAAAALRDIFAAAAAGGAEVPDLSGAGAGELREAIESSSIEVWSGRDDHLLRRLRLEISFRVEPPRGLRRDLGELVGGRLSFAVDLGRINAPVRVGAPADPRPAAELGGG